MPYPKTITLTPLSSPPHTTVSVPGSKSITNRAMIMAALAAGDSTLLNALDSDDTRVMADSLTRLGFHVVVEPARQAIHVGGLSGVIPAAEAELMLNNSGTSIRFLTALTALGHGRYRLDGSERMRERPQQELLNALQSLGVAAQAERNNGCPPLVVCGTGRLPGGELRMSSEASSQFLTAMLMVAPYASEPLDIGVEGNLRPFYVEITCRMMEQWGVQCRRGESETERPITYGVPNGQVYKAQPAYTIEPDASSASYFFAAAAVTGGSITVPGLSADALQGDIRFATEVLVEMGCTVTVDARGVSVTGPEQLQGIDRDMSAISDTSLTLAAIAPFACSPTRIRNIGHARLQECDRVSAACAELRRLGIRVDEVEDGLTVYPANKLEPAVIQTYGDHRVAMSFALVGLRSPGITIEDPGCVAKTFPDYWAQLEALRGAINTGS